MVHRTNPRQLCLITDAISALCLGAGRRMLGSMAVDISDAKGPYEGLHAVLAGTDTLAGAVVSMDQCVAARARACRGCTHTLTLYCDTRTRTHTHTRAHTPTLSLTHTGARVLSRTHTHPHAHTHTHTHTHTQPRPRHTLMARWAGARRCVRNYVRFTECSPAQALKAASTHPSLALGVHGDHGRLTFGGRADMVLLDRALNVKATFLEGSCVWMSPSLAAAAAEAPAAAAAAADVK
jgi:N-acetylglucosamine-6-phosphate deacetylase